MLKIKANAHSPYYHAAWDEVQETPTVPNNFPKSHGQEAIGTQATLSTSIASTASHNPFRLSKNRCSLLPSSRPRSDS